MADNLFAGLMISLGFLVPKLFLVPIYSSLGILYSTGSLSFRGKVPKLELGNQEKVVALIFAQALTRFSHQFRRCRIQSFWL